MKQYSYGKRNLEKTSHFSSIAKFVSFCMHLKSFNESNGNFKKKTHQNSRAGLFEKIALVLVSRLAYVVESTSWYLRKVFFPKKKKETFRFQE